MYFRHFLNDENACASYVFGCKTAGELAVVDAHADLVGEYVAAAEGQGCRIAAVLETHLLVTLGNTVIQAVATPGHAPAHHAYLVTDHRRGEEPWMVLTGDALLVGAAGRPDLHAGGERSVEEMARSLYRSITERLLALPDHLLLYPGHYAGSVCGAGLSGHPASTIGFERRHNDALALAEDDFVTALVESIPPPPEHQAEIVAANRDGRIPASRA